MKKVLKWLGIIVGGLLGLTVLIAVGLALYTSLVFKRTDANRPLYPITADVSPAGVERGKYLMENAMSCTIACHTPEGGQAFIGWTEELKEGPVEAVLTFPNLTPDVETGLGGWTDAEIARAIREGVDKDGVALIIMPSHNYHVLSDADVAAMVGYLRSVEPVNNPLPPTRVNLLAQIMNVMGMFGPDPVQAPITAAQSTPPTGSVEYGRYMVKLGACNDCHLENLAGGVGPFAEGGMPAANLTPAGELPGWTADDFVKAVREGVKPDGGFLSDQMPRYGTSEDDLKDIFAYLQTLPPAPMNE